MTSLADQALGAILTEAGEEILLEDGLGISEEGIPRAVAAVDTWVADVSDPTFTHPWESFISGAPPGRPVPIPFPPNFDKAKMLAWDREPLDYIDLKKLMADDSSWASHSGRPSNYWRPDDVENTFVLYPRPDNPTWDDYVRPDEEPCNYSYTYDWEVSDAYIVGPGYLFTPEHSDIEITYIFPWENEHLDSGDCLRPDALARSTDALVVGLVKDLEGMVTHVGGDTQQGDEAGTIGRRSGTFFGDSLPGITTDVLDIDDNVLLIYRIIPTELHLDSDKSDFHEYLQKYVEYGVLERAYAVDNDGKIDSLRDYWGYRKELGLKHIKTFMSKRLADRDFRMVTPGVSGRTQRRHPRLPSEYPPI